MKKVIVAMSGGVDSSVAAFLLKEQGYQCIGATMKLFHNEDIGIRREHTCCSLDDVEDARSIARRLDIPYYVFNFSDCFQECVMDRFVYAYENGMTPNPCIDCNHYLKFNKLFQRAKELSFDYVATGHYARIEYNSDSGKYMLKKAVDSNKDQSYMLYTMTQEQLSHTLFPLGDMIKPQVREVAEHNGFCNARKHDSQDICFVQNGSYADFIKQYTGRDYPQGYFVDANGNIIGMHKGIINYTVGQRRNLGISSSKPMYVCKICADSNTVVLGDAQDLFSKEAKITNLNWISGTVPTEPIRCKAKIRYRQQEQWAVAYPLVNGDVYLEFDEPQRALTPGQAAVLYDEDIVIGGGIIL
ncbi:MAG: tRNA 2-thiouridine(34) synthase MnmA [Oscillospiraceae bacterium]